ncbi:MAG: hypothetical protein AB8F94_05610 [Saprospiraceae bacterium]
MNIIPEYFLEMVVAYKMTNSKPKKYTIAEGHSDSCLGMSKNQPGVSDSKLNLSTPSSVNIEDSWIDADKEGLITMFELVAATTSTEDKDQLSLELKANDQIHYIFISDDSGKIWYEHEVNPFQQILKIDTHLFPTGSYNILMENDGSFSAKRLVKIK